MKKTVITVHNNFECRLHHGMLKAVLERCESMIYAREGQEQTIDVYTRPRNSEGWLEWSVIINDRTDHSMFIGVIQRKPEAEIEFCS